MTNKLGPIEVTCDAPPFFIVHACQRIGLTSPEDVRWSRLSDQGGAQAGWRQLLGFPSASTATICHCGQPLPRLEAYTFTLVTAKEISYLLGQCSRCHTIYWDDA